MKKIQLPKSTNRCDKEPYIQMKNDQVIIRYSCEDEAVNSIISIKFKLVYSFTYTECEYINTLNYSFGLIEVENSKIKSNLLTIWK